MTRILKISTQDQENTFNSEYYEIENSWPLIGTVECWLAYMIRKHFTFMLKPTSRKVANCLFIVNVRMSMFNPYHRNSYENGLPLGHLYHQLWIDDYTVPDHDSNISFLTFSNIVYLK